MDAEIIMLHPPPDDTSPPAADIDGGARGADTSPGDRSPDAAFPSPGHEATPDNPLTAEQEATLAEMDEKLGINAAQIEADEAVARARKSIESAHSRGSKPTPEKDPAPDTEATETYVPTDYDTAALNPVPADKLKSEADALRAQLQTEPNRVSFGVGLTKEDAQFTLDMWDHNLSLRGIDTTPATDDALPPETTVAPPTIEGRIKEARTALNSSLQDAESLPESKQRDQAVASVKQRIIDNFKGEWTERTIHAQLNREAAGVVDKQTKPKPVSIDEDITLEDAENAFDEFHAKLFPENESQAHTMTTDELLEAHRTSLQLTRSILSGNQDMTSKQLDKHQQTLEQFLDTLESYGGDAPKHVPQSELKTAIKTLVAVKESSRHAYAIESSSSPGEEIAAVEEHMRRGTDSRDYDTEQKAADRTKKREDKNTDVRTRKQFTREQLQRFEPLYSKNDLDFATDTEATGVIGEDLKRLRQKTTNAIGSRALAAMQSVGIGKETPARRTTIDGALLPDKDYKELINTMKHDRTALIEQRDAIRIAVGNAEPSAEQAAEIQSLQEQIRDSKAAERIAWQSQKRGERNERNAATRDARTIPAPTAESTRTEFTPAADIPAPSVENFISYDGEDPSSIKNKLRKAANELEVAAGYAHNESQKISLPRSRERSAPQADRRPETNLDGISDRDRKAQQVQDSHYRRKQAAQAASAKNESTSAS